MWFLFKSAVKETTLKTSCGEITNSNEVWATYAFQAYCHASERLIACQRVLALSKSTKRINLAASIRVSWCAALTGISWDRSFWAEPLRIFCAFVSNSDYAWGYMTEKNPCGPDRTKGCSTRIMAFCGEVSDRNTFATPLQQVWSVTLLTAQLQNSPVVHGEQIIYST